MTVVSEGDVTETETGMGLASSLLLSRASMARLLRRRGDRRKGEGRTWVAKANVEGHVEATILGGEVETCLPTKRPDREAATNWELTLVDILAEDKITW